MDEFRFNDALTVVWNKIKETDQYIDTNEPWKLTGAGLETVLNVAVNNILEIATLIQPFLPETATKIVAQFKGPTIKSGPPLFPRIV